MRLFRTSFNRGSERYFADSGSGIRDKNSVVVLDDGCQVLKKVGETDFYAYIQSFGESVDLLSIIQKCTNSGDPSFLDRSDSVYGDFVGTPNDLATLEQLRMLTESAYDHLPDNVKAALDFSSFVNSFGSDEGISNLNALLNPDPAVPDGGDPVES